MRITGETRILGIFGYPVKHTLSPSMQNAALESLGLNYIYLPFEVRPEELEDAVRSLNTLGIIGVNLTIPHKESVIPFLDEITDEAEVIGSVNTIENKNGRLIGHNTDSGGFMMSLRADAGFNANGKTALVIGAGGAARGVIAGLAREMVHRIFIANRTMEKGERLAKEFGNKFEGTEFTAIPMSSLNDSSIMSSLDLFVNATSMGMEGTIFDIQFSLTPTHVLVSDIVYNPQLTAFLKKAREGGRKTIGGLGMLLYQGAISFEIWTSRKAPIAIMKDVLQKEAQLARQAADS